ncbi:carboxypeptidase family protein [Luteibacter rhizovicinus]|uniref:Carboxypeptidase family protein n=1 Tax=Luteibacter rhizovicinus TaxID=242606 RepID=A0A4R3YKN6_9GAMM|nr:TonB-dependent receptor [Luteibacter rhizovicinus]TCV92826.1 carboxypeptidase family protein [Luteibacter rhizovicinus]
MRASMQIKKKLLASVITASVAAAAVSPMSAYAQSADASLRGKATPAATVTAKNIATGTTRRTTVGADGSYGLIGLPPGTYKVDAGPGTEKTVTLTVASNATLNLSAEAAAAATTTANAANAASLEGLTVQATTLTEVKTPEVGQTISLHQISTIPQVSRNFLEFADTVPGMVFSVDAQGHTSLRGGAQNNSSTNVYIDGVGQKSYVKEGGISGQNASQGNPFPQLAIGEYKVITSNYKAEYDQVSSAAVTAETKSGTNEFHGEVFGTYTNDAFRNRTAAEEYTGKKSTSDSKEYGFAVGGPIIKDKMHFFIAYEEKKFNSPISVVPGTVNYSNVQSLLPASAQAELGPTNLPFNEKLYFGKIDWELTDRDRIEISTQVRRETQLDGVGSGPIAGSAGFNNVNHDTRATFKWQHSGESWFNELMFTYENAFVNPTPVNDAIGSSYTFKPQQDALILQTGSASPLATQKKSQEGPSIQDTFTFNDLQWKGDHVVKFGYKFKSVELKAQDAAANNPQFYYDVDPVNGTAATPWKAFFATPIPGLSAVSQTTSRQYGIFAQDDWAVNDHLTLNLGVRWDYEVTPSYTNFVTPQNVIDALNSQDTNKGAPVGQTYAQSLALSGLNINDYISTGKNRKAYKGEWQPRLGFSYDLFADEAHVFHGGAGRAYDRNLYDYLQLEQTKSSLPQTTLYFNGAPGGRTCDLAASNCVQWDPRFLQGQAALAGAVGATNAGQEVDMLNNKLKAPYSDQFSFGMSNRIGEWQTDATVTRVLTHDGFVFTLGNRYPTPGFFQDKSQPWGNPIPGLGGLIIGNNGIATRTTQVLLSAQKPYTVESGWSATFAYTFTHAKQNRAISEHYAFDEASISDYPFITSDAAAKHRFVATGALDLPWGITGSIKMTLATPLPKNDIACYDAVFSNGSGCRPVSAIPRGSKFLVGGDIWGYRDIDLQLTKDFVINADTKVYARFDILNVFNWKNYNDYLTNWGSNGVFNANGAQYNPNGNITFVPRTARFTVGLKF